MFFNGKPTIETQRFCRFGCGDERIAVTVAANPRAKGEKARGNLNFWIILDKGTAQVSVQARGDIPKNGVEKEKSRADFIGHFGTRGAGAVGKPEGLNFGAELVCPLFTFERQEVRTV